MTCLIIDDNPLARALLRQMATSVPFLEVAGECASTSETLDFLQTQSADLLLLDIEMPGMTGLELIKSLPVRPLTILVTAKPEYAVEAFEVPVLDYLVKPIAFPRFVMAAQRAKEAFDSRNGEKPRFEKDSIFVRSNTALLKIRFDELLWAEAMGDYVVFQLADKKHVVYTTLRQVEEKLPPDQFLRIHRGYIVSLKKIEKLEEGRVIVHQTTLPVGETFKTSLLNRLNLL